MMDVRVLSNVLLRMMLEFFRSFRVKVKVTRKKKIKIVMKNQIKLVKKLNYMRTTQMKRLKKN